MSQPENHPPDTEDLEPKFLHIKAIEIKFTGTRPPHPISIKIQLKDESKNSLPSPKSREFGKNEDVLRWEPEDYFHFSISTDFVILVRVVHKFRPKNVFAAFAITSADIAGKEAYSAIDEKGRSELRLSCVTVSQTGDFTKVLVEEAKGQVGNKKVFLESLGKVNEVLAFLMPFTELASGVHPAIGAAVKLVNVLYEKCKLQKECHEAAATLMEDLVSFLPFIKDPPPDVMTNVDVRKTVTRMLVLFCEISRSIIKYSKVGYLGDLIISHKGEFDSLKGEFEGLKGVYDWHLKVATWKSTMKIERIVTKMGEDVEDIRLKRLYVAGNAHYSSEGCLERTRATVFSQVMEWADSESKVFWLHGVAGSGKSSIAHSVCHMFEEQRRLLGCFFCKRDDPECRVSENIIPTLAYSFAKWNKGYRSELLSVIQGVDELKLNDVQWQHELLMDGPLKSLTSKSMDVPPRPLIAVIDALDECGTSVKSWLGLARMLVKLSGIVPWLKIFVTGRPLPEFQKAFSQETVSCLRYNLNTGVDSSEVEQDILQYTESCADDFAISLSKGQMTSLASKASGLFIWTSTVFKFISEQNDQQKVINGILMPTLKGSTLDGLYDTVVKSASVGQDNAQIVEAILGVIAHASKNRPIADDAILHFVSAIYKDANYDAVC